MGRWTHFKQNAGRRGVALTLIVLAGMSAVGVSSVVNDPASWPALAGLAGGFALPWALTGLLVARPAWTQNALHAWGLVILIFAVAGEGVVRSGPWGLAALTALVGGYLGTYTAFTSDPRIEELKD